MASEAPAEEVNPNIEVEIVPGVMGRESITGQSRLSPGKGEGAQLLFDIRFDPELRRYVCDKFTAVRDATRPSSPITTELLRRVKVAYLIKEIVHGEDEMGGPYVRVLDNPGDRDPWGILAPDDVRAEGPSDRALRWTAHLYRYAYALSFTSPTAAVETGLGVSLATAPRWVGLARRAGYLEPAERPGKAGG